jgi:hemerythrin-like domain-containing protein
MNERTELLRREHRQLRELADDLCEAARALPMLDHQGRRDVQRHLASVLRERVSPHTWLDERVLYPEVTARLGDALVTVSMNYDHQAIRSWIEDFAEADPRNLGRLQELLYGLHALITVHTWKEDELYVAALENASWPGVAAPGVAVTS